MSDIQLTGFDMQNKLGEGGMAAVWKARQISLDRTVAIKILSSHFASDPTDIQRFQQEAQSAAKLKHPGIVQVYDANIENGLYFFVMEFVDGYTCADWLKRKGTLTEKDVLLIADCVADALGYAWEKENMIHCDIKPDNIMIDEDGTVKVTDLGLSRMVSGMNVDDESDEILGTPAYMAPEQAMGEANQDCRLDMYALGAMMYHLSTGKLLFEGAGESEVMERQITDTVENPRDLNSSLSRGFCSLVRALMCKDKTHRPPDWAHVRDAISRVKKGLSPRLKLPDEAVSTVMKSAKAAEEASVKSQIAAHATAPAAVPKKSGGIVGIAVGIAVILVAAVIGAKVFMGGRKPPRVDPSNGGPASGNNGAAQQPNLEARARDLYYSASNWEKANRGSYDESMRRYREVIVNCDGTKYADRASKDIARLRAAKETDAMAGVLASLDGKVRPYIARHEYERAISIFETYSGVAAAETKAERDKKVSELRSRKVAWEAQEKARKAAALAAKYNEVMGEAVALVVKGDYKQAADYLTDVSIEGSLPDRNDEIHEVKDLFELAANMDAKVLESFDRQANQSVSVHLLAGAKRLTIQGVKGDLVMASEVFSVGGASAMRANNFRLSDLSMAEKLSRMGNDSEPEVALVKGVMAYQSRAFSHARRYFEMTHHLIAPRLVALLDGSKKEVEGEARRALVEILGELGVNVGSSFDGPSAAGQVAAAQVDATTLSRAKAKVAAYSAKYSSAGMYAGVKPVVDAVNALQPSAVSDVPEDVEEVDKAPIGAVEIPPEAIAAAKDIDAVVDGLLRTNPDLESENIRCRRNGEGIVSELSISGHGASLRDISPVSTLKGLRRLETRVWGSDPSQLVDLGPLRGLSLVSLDLDNSKVQSLEPLEGMPLRELCVRGSQVRDLKPIVECPLEFLDVSGSKVFDFTPISKMNLERLYASGTQIRSLTFLRNTKLKELRINNTGVFDFSPLSLLPLEVLHAEGTQLRTLSFARNCPLEVLQLDRTSVTDLSPLSACSSSLKQLYIADTKVRGFTVFRGLNLTHLSLAHTDFVDLSLIRHMTLSHLNVEGTRLKDLTGLKSEEMRYLNIANTEINSISLLDGSPIEELDCRGSQVRNFRPVYGSGLERLWIDRPASKWSLYREIPRLKRVNGKWLASSPQF